MFLLLWYSPIVAHDHTNVPDFRADETREALRYTEDDDDLLMLWWAINEYQ